MYAEAALLVLSALIASTFTEVFVFGSTVGF
jgi:hypothetical protein